MSQTVKRRSFADVCRRAMVEAIIRAAEKKRKRLPSQSKIGAVIGINQSNVCYHMRRIRMRVPCPCGCTNGEDRNGTDAGSRG